MPDERSLDYQSIVGPGVDALERREPLVMAGEYLRQAELSLTVESLTIEGYKNATKSALSLIRGARAALTAGKSQS